MTIDDVIYKLIEMKKQFGNVEVAIMSRDEDIYGYFDSNLGFRYYDEKGALVKNTLVL